MAEPLGKNIVLMLYLLNLESILLYKRIYLFLRNIQWIISRCKRPWCNLFQNSTRGKNRNREKMERVCTNDRVSGISCKQSVNLYLVKETEWFGTVYITMKR